MDDRALLFEKLLIENIDLFLSRGGNLVCQAFGYEKDNSACALSTISLNLGCGVIAVVKRYPEFLNEKTGIKLSLEELWSFIDGFDGRAYLYNSTDDQFLLLGKKLREKYEPGH